MINYNPTSKEELDKTYDEIAKDLEEQTIRRVVKGGIKFQQIFTISLVIASCILIGTGIISWWVGLLSVIVLPIITGFILVGYFYKYSEDQNIDIEILKRIGKEETK